MKFQKTLLASSVAIATLALVACGGDDSSQDSGSSSSTSFTGLVIDGRIANGFVWIDMNEDGKWESGEPKAYTDADGYYSYNYEKNINYCSGTGANERYCLNSNALTGYSLVRLTGGTEVSTGQKFRGMLTSVVYPRYNGSLTTSGVFDTRSDYYGWIYPILRAPVPTPPVQVPYSVMTPSTTMLWSAAQRIGATTDPVTNPAQTVQNALVGSGTPDQNSLLTSQLVPPVDSTSTSWSVTQNQAKLQLAGQTTMNLAANIVTRATTSTNTPTLDTVLGSLSSRISSATTTTSVVDLPPADLETVFSRVGVSSASSEATTLRDGLQASNKLIDQISTSGIAETLRAAQTAQATIDRAVALALDPNATSTQKTNSNNVISNVSGNADTLVTQIKNQQAGTTKSVVVVDTLVKKLETAGTDIATAVSDAAVEEADPGIWVTHYLSMSGKDNNGTETTSDDKIGRAILFFKGKAGDQSGEVAVCYAFSDPSQTKTEDKKRVGHLTAGWTAIPGLGVVDITSQYGDFQIQATGKVSPKSDDDNGKYFLGFGDDETNTFGRFTFKSDEFDQDAVWYSDHLSVTDSANSSYEQWGLRALPTGQTVPTKKSECDDVLLADSKTLLSNLPSTVFTASDFNN